MKKKITLEIWAEYKKTETPSGSAFYAELQGHANNIAKLFGEVADPAKTRQTLKIKNDNHRERDGKP